MAALDAFEQSAERRVDLVMWYQDWASTRELDLSLLQRVADHGAVPMLTWEPWDHTRGPKQPDFALSRILLGEFDRYLRDFGRNLARYSGPLFLRFAHEMNGHWYPWGLGAQMNTAREFVSAWRHVWTAVRSEGATSVAWVWSPNIVQGAAAFEACYPGSEFVDWLGLDGYDRGGWGRARSFRDLFGESYARIAALGPQPIMIAETACAERRGKPGWITDAFSQIMHQDFSRLRAVVWFNQRKERDWRIESSPHSRLAFARAVARLEG